MWMGLHLFGDICPKCSDPKWYSDIYSVPVDYKSRNLPDRLQLLQNGVCPKCGGRKSNFVKKEQKYAEGLIYKTNYEQYKKNKDSVVLGDYECIYCPYNKGTCQKYD
jgi:hypothetical protein